MRSIVRTARSSVSEWLVGWDMYEGWGYRGDSTVQDWARRWVLVRAAHSRLQELLGAPGEGAAGSVASEIEKAEAEAEGAGLAGHEWHSPSMASACLQQRH